MYNSAAEIQFRLNAPVALPKQELPKDVRRHAVGRLPRVAQVMALAIHFQDMIQRGESRDYADLARLGCLTRERMSQIMELIWLAPEIQQEILEFPPTTKPRFPVSEVSVRRIAEKLRWTEQRDLWGSLKKQNHLD
jgi:hypothetical protein